MQPAQHAFGSTWHQPEPTRPAPTSPPPGWAMAPAPEPEQGRIRFEILVVLLIAAVPGFIIGLEGIGDPQQVTTDVATLELLAMVAAAAGPALLAYHFLWRDKRLGVAGFGRRSPGFVVGYGLLGLVVVYMALFGAAIVAGSIFVALGGDVESLSETSDDDGVALTAASLVVAYVISITAGITEEVLFRAYAITRLEELGWRRAAVIVPGVVFTLLHLYQGLVAVVLIGAITVAFTWLFRWKRSIWPVMVTHALFDAVQLTIAAFAGS
jgi:membrane protease YdiL (CAAX protease family)